MTRIALLEGSVKHYDWGGTQFIPNLLQENNKAQKPYAEYWLGAHPLANNMVVETDNKSSLNTLIANDPHRLLGEKVHEKFKGLPFLLKALDVKGMLSIQVHPSKESAATEFALENERGIPIDAPNRNYKDPNHKPELMVALGEFWLLHGFKKKIDLLNILNSNDEFKSLVPVFESRSYAGLYKYVMELSQPEVDQTLLPLLKRIVPKYQENNLDKNSPEFWAARAATSFGFNQNIDRGIFSIYFFNLLHLKRGEGIFQAAGIPHAYLEGQNVEIMANSDNVLRGGLTTKHVDVPELLKHTRFEETEYKILTGGEELECIYHTPAPDFELSCFKMEAGMEAFLQTSTCEIFLLTEGSATLTSESSTIELKYGRPSAIVFPGNKVLIEAKEKTIIFRATVPDSQR